jgi:hypothetical protein
MAEESPADPAIMIADKGYDGDAIRADLDSRGVVPIIPPRSNRRN